MLGKAMTTMLMEYNYRANLRILDHASKVTSDELDTPSDYSHGSLHQTLFHMLRNEWDWRHICEHHVPPTPRLRIEQFPTIEGLRAHHDAETQLLRDFLQGLSEDDLAETVTITWWTGKMHNRVVWYMLADITYHSAQHRSEAAALLTRYGQSPGDYDFVFLM